MKYYAIARKAKRDCSGIIARAIISSNTRDLAGTIVRQSGIILPEKVSLLATHDDGKVIGYATNFKLEGERTTADVIILEADYVSLVRNTAITGLSVGLDILEGEDRPGGTISKSKLLELSLTPIPANPDAEIMVDTIKPFCSVEEGGAVKKAVNKPEAKKAVSSRLTRQVKHYRGAVKSKLVRLKKILSVK